jgi:hypothetical protein
MLKGSDPSGPGNGFTQKLQPFRTQLRREESIAGNVGPWPGETGDESVGQRISQIPADNRYRRCRVLGGKSGRGPTSNDHVDIEVNELGGRIQ